MNVSPAGLPILLLLFSVLLPSASVAEPLTLKRAVTLALTHSTGAVMAEADQQRALASYREARNAYAPQFTLGSALGKSSGFPLSLEGAAPSIFNVNTQSVLLNPSVRDFVRAARSEANAASFDNKDRRNEVILETVLDYLELLRWQQQIEQLRQEEARSHQMEAAVEARVKEGVDSPLDRDKASLASARIRLRRAEAGGSADFLRTRLAQLTGLPLPSIEPVADSVPAFPAPAEEEDIPARATAISPVIQSAMEHAQALQFRARGEHRALWPSLDFAGQYALLAKFNNYQDFFKSFQRNNGSVGVVMRLPFFNLAQRSRAQAADAEALRARKSAEAAKEHLSAETLRLQRMVEQLAAARDVAQLEHKVAQSTLDAVETRAQAGSASFHDLEDARLQARERRNQYEDASLQFERARVNLLRSTGELENWVNNAP
jgi:outer membrane protein TolC